MKISCENLLRMSDTETLKFLEYYRNEPALWDPTNDEYKKGKRVLQQPDEL